MVLLFHVSKTHDTRLSRSRRALPILPNLRVLSACECRVGDECSAGGATVWNRSNETEACPETLRRRIGCITYVLADCFVSIVFHTVCSMIGLGIEESATAWNRSHKTQVCPET